MKKVEIKGIIPPIITPMNADESINVPVLRQQVERQIENGVHAIFCFGTNGEGYILSGEEKKLVLETVVEQANGRVPVYAGTGCVSTRETIRQSKGRGGRRAEHHHPLLRRRQPERALRPLQGRGRGRGHAHRPL